MFCRTFTVSFVAIALAMILVCQMTSAANVNFSNDSGITNGSSLTKPVVLPVTANNNHISGKFYIYFNWIK